MRPHAFLFTILFAALLDPLFGTSADAGPRPTSHGGSPSRLLGGNVVPAAWAGIWSTVDSTYDCQDILQSTDSSLDTLCTGQASDPGTGECIGTITDNSIDITCNYSELIDTDCTLTISIEVHGTRTSNSYLLTITSMSSTAGTSKGCDLFPSSCSRTVSRGTRIASEPLAYCSTPVDPTTWGRVKSRYR